MSRFHGKWKVLEYGVIYDKQDYFYPFWASLVKKKSKLTVQDETCYLDKCHYAEFDGSVYFSSFDHKYHFGQIWSKKSKLFKMKVGN